MTAAGYLPLYRLRGPGDHRANPGRVGLLFGFIHFFIISDCRPLSKQDMAGLNLSGPYPDIIMNEIMSPAPPKGIIEKYYFLCGAQEIIKF